MESVAHMEIASVVALKIRFDITSLSRGAAKCPDERASLLLRSLRRRMYAPGAFSPVPL